jgi:TatD DNase family protein
VTFERALRIRRVGRAVAATAIVMETDSPDIPPQWRYRTAEARAAGATMRNEPAELARIGAELAGLRGGQSGARRRDDGERGRVARLLPPAR